ncbi:MAG: cytochrome c biogenesis protein CcsA [Luteolibacter sp.]
MNPVMDRVLLLVSTLLALIGAVMGVISVQRGRRSRWTTSWMLGVLLFQFGFLSLRGEQRGACPLADHGEILVFLSWSLTLFYLIIGPAYRISLLGVFTAPVVAIFQIVALVPGVMSDQPERLSTVNAWHETHAATSVLAYGALALASVAGVMFLVLDKQLKSQHFTSGWFRNLPPVRELLVSLRRLLWTGGFLLTLGVIAGWLMPHGPNAAAHWIAALMLWIAYLCLLGVMSLRGLTGRALSLATVSLFLLSLAVFAWI